MAKDESKAHEMADGEKMPRYKAKKESAPKFTDFGESAKDYSQPMSPSKGKTYPTVHIRKNIPGLDKIGAKKTVRMKVRVHSLESRNGEEPHVGLEIHGIHHGGADGEI
jgi:hypothetical protein